MARTCPKCGVFINGILEESTHPCNGTTIEYKQPTDNEMREFFLEIGMPTMGFTALGFAEPTEMERLIFKKDYNEKSS